MYKEYRDAHCQTEGFSVSRISMPDSRWLEPVLLTSSPLRVVSTLCSRGKLGADMNDAPGATRWEQLPRSSEHSLW